MTRHDHLEAVEAPNDVDCTGYLVAVEPGHEESIEVTAFGSQSFRLAMIRSILKVHSGLALEAVSFNWHCPQELGLRDDHDRAASAAAHLVAGGAQQPSAGEVLIAAPEDQQICPVGRGCGGKLPCD
jgi:hypothetical protein